MKQAPVAALVERYGLSERAVPGLEALAELLASDPLAPTTVRSRAAILNDHLADSLVALELPEVRAAARVADLGSGAGLPGLPLAIALPEAAVCLVESNGRKCEFLERARRAGDATNASVVHARAEEWVDGRDSCDLVTARALAPLGVVAEYAAPLLVLGGSLIAWRGRRDLVDEVAAGRAAGALGLELRAPQPVIPYPGALYRHLHLLVKVAPTPPGFPRRAGMARKRPLGEV